PLRGLNDERERLTTKRWRVTALHSRRGSPEVHRSPPSSARADSAELEAAGFAVDKRGCKLTE
ncbi:MAG: hypothetical protein ACLFWL_19175, partial [Candidatus Brocadiia bacterium]